MTIAVVLTMGLSSFAQDGGLLNRGVNFDKQEKTDGMITPSLPGHNKDTDQNAPLGGGIAVMLGLGAAYLIGKKRNEE